MKPHVWFTSYGDFAGWADLAYWWSCIGKGLRLKHAQQACYCVITFVINTGSAPSVLLLVLCLRESELAAIGHLFFAAFFLEEKTSKTQENSSKVIFDLFHFIPYLDTRLSPQLFICHAWGNPLDSETLWNGNFQGIKFVFTLIDFL